MMQSVEKKKRQSVHLQGQKENIWAVWSGKAAADIQQICGKSLEDSQTVCASYLQRSRTGQSLPPSVTGGANTPSGNAEKLDMQ